MGAEHHEARAVGLGHRLADPGLERVEVVGDLAEVEHVPPVGAEPAGRVVGERELGGAVDRDVVVVVDRDQPAEPEVTGERRRLVADALREAAVARDHERVVVGELAAEPLAQVGLGERDADRVGDALTERSGGDLDPGGVAVLGVARRTRSPLPELLEVAQLEAVAGEVEHRVEQRGHVTVREDEAVAVGPLGRRRVVAHDPGEEHVRQRRERERRALVPGLRLLDRIEREPTDHVDAALLQISHRPGSSA